MIVTSDFRQLPAGRKVFVLGNFDGVHLGHQRLFQSAAKLAASCQGQVVAMAFHPHPLQVLGYQLELLTPERDKIKLIAEQGVAAYFAMPFTRELADLSPESFVQDVLLRQAAASAVVVGFNFSFGRGGVGTPEFLQTLLAAQRVPVQIVPPVLVSGEAVSSTRIRQLLRQGDLTEAAALLGRPYCITGVVQQGDQRGRTIGYPTANLTDLAGLALPPYGVYAAEVAGIGPAMANLGVRPSFPQAGPTLETHILDWQGDLYSQLIEVRLLRFLRPEQRFDSLQQLARQLVLDQLAVRQWLAPSSSA